VCFSCFCRWRWLSPPAEEDREEEDFWSTDFWSPSAAARGFLVSISDGGALEHAPPAVPASNSCAEGFPCNFRLFEDYFVKFELFDVIFIYFLNICNLYWGCKKKEKKKKTTKKRKRKRKKRETKMYVCIYFRDFLWWDGKRIKKNLIFWSDHGVEVQTCTEVVFLKSDEKTKFFKLI